MKQRESEDQDQANPRTKSEREDLQPAEERGERLDTGRTIARGGKDEGPVPGATEQK